MNLRQDIIRTAKKEIEEALEGFLEEGIHTPTTQADRWACEDILQNCGILYAIGEESRLPKNWRAILAGGEVSYYGGLEILKSFRDMPSKIGQVMGDNSMFPNKAPWEQRADWIIRILESGTFVNVLTPNEEEVISLSWLAWTGSVGFRLAEKDFLPDEMVKISEFLDQAEEYLYSVFADPIVMAWFKPYIKQRADEYLSLLVVDPPSFLIP